MRFNFFQSILTSAFSLTTLERVLLPPGVKLFLSPPSLERFQYTFDQFQCLLHTTLIIYWVVCYSKKLVKASRSWSVAHLLVALCSLFWLPLRDSVTLRPPSIPLNSFWLWVQLYSWPFFWHYRTRVMRASYRAIFGPSQGPECFSKDNLLKPINT